MNNIIKTICAISFILLITGFIFIIEGYKNDISTDYIYGGMGIISLSIIIGNINFFYYKKQKQITIIDEPRPGLINNNNLGTNIQDVPIQISDNIDTTDDSNKDKFISIV